MLVVVVIAMLSLESVALGLAVLSKLVVVSIVETGSLVEVSVSASVSALVTVVVVAAAVAVLGPGVDVVGVAAADADAGVLLLDAGLQRSQ